MFDGGQFLGFLAAVVVLILVPGPNTILILANSLSGGRSVGLATAIGVEIGTVFHTVAAALGLSAVLSTSALAFDLVKYGGAAYLVVLGVRMLRHGENKLVAASSVGRDLSRTMGRAAFTNVINPKVALFFLAFLPQFTHPERGNLLLQFVLLGLVVSTVGLILGSTLALTAGSFATWLNADSAFGRWQRRRTSSVLVGLGVRLALARRT